MSTERERLINWAKQLADPNWCLSVYVLQNIADWLTGRATTLRTAS